MAGEFDSVSRVLLWTVACAIIMSEEGPHLLNISRCEMKNIGKRIKELRKKNELTQEKLADLLGVTYKSVSKWETGVTFPDLALIVPLAKILHVTTDELLGVCSSETDERLAQLEADYNDTFKTGNISDRLKIAEEAVKEFPGDMNWLSRYARDAWCQGIDDGIYGEEFEKIREKAIKLFDTVIGNTEDDV